MSKRQLSLKEAYDKILKLGEVEQEEVDRHLDNYSCNLWTFIGNPFGVTYEEASAAAYIQP